ncbi:MAG: hypothetical protein ACK4N5_06185 [Myxococcales bacterium]
MKFDVTVKQLSDGTWLARYLGGSTVEPLTAGGTTREAALERMRETIRYHLEYCP